MDWLPVLVTELGWGCGDEGAVCVCGRCVDWLVYMNMNMNMKMNITVLILMAIGIQEAILLIRMVVYLILRT